jgi:predicted nucleotidyltransferase
MVWRARSRYPTGFVTLASSPEPGERLRCVDAMKTALDHLPEKKQLKLRALGELICKEAPVEMVILFGSFARGDWVEDPVGGYVSDFDVLVIVKTPGLVDKVQLWSTIEPGASPSRRACRSWSTTSRT